MIKRLIWTIWTPMSSVLKKADKLNLSLSLSSFLQYMGAPVAYVQQVVVRAVVSPWSPRKLIQTDAFRAPLAKAFDVLEQVNQFHYKDGWVWLPIVNSLYPPLQWSWKGGILVGILVSPCLSVNRIVSALYLQQYSSDPFHICTSYQATSGDVSYVMFVSKFKNLKFCQILYMCNFHFVFFWLGIQYDSMVWVIMRWWGVSSERRRSSCLWETWMKI